MRSSALESHFGSKLAAASTPAARKAAVVGATLAAWVLGVRSAASKSAATAKAVSTGDTPLDLGAPATDVFSWAETADLDPDDVPDGLSDLLDTVPDDPQSADVATVSAYASEAGASEAYQSGGVTQIDVVPDGGACDTCQDAADSGPYDVGDEPTPMHNGCGCETSPADEQERQTKYGGSMKGVSAMADIDSKPRRYAKARIEEYTERAAEFAVDAQKGNKVAQAGFDDAMFQIDKAKRQLDTLQKVEPTPRKAGPHEKDARHSWTGDMFALAKYGRASREGQEALKRLEATNKVEHSRAASERSSAIGALERSGVLALDVSGNRAEQYRTKIIGDVQVRDITTTDGSGGEFSPPGWLVSQWASISRSASTLMAACEKAGTLLPLPDGIDAVYIPTFTEFDDTTGYAPPGAYAVPTSSSLNSPVDQVVTLLTVSQQILDRTPSPGLDAVLMREGAEGFSAFWESELFVGDGEGDGGIFNNAGIYQVNYTGSTVTELVESVAKAAANVGNLRERQAEAVFVAPARAAWFAGFPDTTVGAPTWQLGHGIVNSPATPDECAVFGPIAGLPAYSSGALNVDPGNAQDAVMVGRPSDLLLMRSAPVFEIQTEGAQAAQVSAVFRARSYVASILRYPTGWASVYGTGTARWSGLAGPPRGVKPIVSPPGDTAVERWRPGPCPRRPRSREHEPATRRERDEVQRTEAVRATEVRAVLHGRGAGAGHCPTDGTPADAVRQVGDVSRGDNRDVADQANHSASSTC